MTLVTSIQQIEDNFNVFSMAIAERNPHAIELVKNGKSIVVGNINGELFFAPSRFLGYQDNDIDQHFEMRSKRDGKKTNPAIQKALGIEKSPHVSAEAEFLRHCSALGISPPANQRQYWILPDAIELLDLEAIEHDPSVGKTEKMQLQKARLGQGKFRAKLETRWGRCCCITGCKIRAVLRASHIKPWKDCDNEERLDGNNGLLLVANLDALFDKGLISFSQDGSLLRSEEVTEFDLEMLVGCKVSKLNLNSLQEGYMQYHRKLYGFA